MAFNELTHTGQRLTAIRGSRRHGSRRGRQGFTMIEIMVAIAIILILMAIGVVGYRSLDKSSSLKSTHVALNNCESFVAEYEAAGKSASTLPGSTGGPIPSSNYADVSPGANGRTIAISNAEAPIKVLLLVDKNKTMFAGLPTKALVDLNGTRRQVLADGWGNPIIFVPRGGITTNLGKNSSGTSYSKPGAIITAPTGRPFWASAGPDGDFSTGDDNIYSFEK